MEAAIFASVWANTVLATEINVANGWGEDRFKEGKGPEQLYGTHLLTHLRRNESKWAAPYPKKVQPFSRSLKAVNNFFKKEMSGKFGV